MNTIPPTSQRICTIVEPASIGVALPKEFDSNPAPPDTNTSLKQAFTGDTYQWTGLPSGHDHHDAGMVDQEDGALGAWIH